MDPKVFARKALSQMTSSRQNIVMLVLGILIIFFGSYAMTGYLVGNPPVRDNPAAGFPSFIDNGGEICTIDGKPVIRMYSTTTCPHCSWIKGTFDDMAREYVSQGKLAAMHWELDVRDDSLTLQKENSIPQEEIDLFLSNSNGGGVPTYVMGCRYSRLGNAHEGQGGLPAEEAEFRALIEHLIKETSR